MAKFKSKNIEIIAEEAKNRVLNVNGDILKVGIIVSAQNFSCARNYLMVQAKLLEREIQKNNIETEILPIPTIYDRYLELTSKSNLLGAFSNQIADMLEVVLFERNFDAVVLMPSGVSSTVGFLTASIRHNLPTLILPEGLSLQTPGATLLDLAKMTGKIAKGEKNVFDLQNVELQQNELVGSGINFNTENLLNILLESVGLLVEGASFACPGSIEKNNIIKQTSFQLAEMLKDRLGIKKYLGKKMMTNAIVLNYALGGSMQILEILMKLCAEIEIEISFEKALSYCSTPLFFDTINNLPFDFKNQNGINSLLKTLLDNKMIDGNLKCYNNTLLCDKCKNGGKFEKVKKGDSIIEFKGNLCEKYAFAKNISLPNELTKFEGAAMVYNSDELAANAVLSRAVPKHSVIVILNSGLNSGKGKATISQCALAIEGMNLIDDYVIVTDGNILDSSKVVCISNVTPDSLSGNLACVKEGDKIEIDFVKGKLNVDLSSKEINGRLKKVVREHTSTLTAIKNYLKLTNN